MIFIKTEQEIERMRAAGALLVETHKNIAKIVTPGISTMDIEYFVEEFLRSRGAKPEQKGYRGYPYAICASVNDEICHGFPRKEKLRDGDLLTVDMVVNLDGWLADSAWSYAVGDISSETEKLMQVTHKALYLGIEQARAGNRLGDIGHAIQSYVEAQGFSVVRDFVGHGIGKIIHEDPQVPHYGTAGRGVRLVENMVITVEPMINIGTYRMKTDDNGWTARTQDGKWSCQYEHTIVIRNGEPEILTYQGEND